MYIMRAEVLDKLILLNKYFIITPLKTFRLVGDAPTYLNFIYQEA